MERRTFLRTVGVGAGALASGGLVAANEDSDAEENPTPADGWEVYGPKINEIRSPLAGVPEVVEAGKQLRVELDAEAGIDPRTATAYLAPSFGSPVRIGLRRVDIDTDPGSRIWNSEAEADGSETEYENVVAVEFDIPGLDSSDAFTPDLYDLVVEWEGGPTAPTGGEDRQPRAVSVRESIPETLDVAVIADPQLGDPRGMQSGFEESRTKEDPEPFVQRTRRVSGDRPDERWAATRRAVAEVNALDPDIVLVAGDLCLGQDAPGKFYAEYEDAWEVMNRVRAPTFCTAGNHDAYVQSGTDGKALYRETFGPPSYSVAVGDAVQIVAVDTYDWSYLDRLGASVAVSTYGGQVRQAQLDWLEDELAEVAATDRSILAFGHHNPSWVPDRKNRAYEETDGRPVAEQVARGSRIAESGQGWTGENVFALRRLFDGAAVDAFFCGHSHQDRLARSMANGASTGSNSDIDGDGVPDGYTGRKPADIVAALGDRYVKQTYDSTDGDTTTRVENYPEVDSEDPGELDQFDPVADLRDGPGTLYVNVASTMSSTSEYWGWRQFDYDTTADGLDPIRFQYPMDREFLDGRAVSPGRWDHDQDEVGLFSTPSYLLDVTRRGSANSPDGRTVTITNDQTVDRSGAVVVSTTAHNPSVESGEVRWRRDAGQRTDLKIGFDVDAGSGTAFTVKGTTPATPGSGGGNGGSGKE
jgi:3',5'-cyclic AMP phosphodiesterase CpdA